MFCIMYHTVVIIYLFLHLLAQCTVWLSLLDNGWNKNALGKTTRELSWFSFIFGCNQQYLYAYDCTFHSRHDFAWRARGPTSREADERACPKHTNSIQAKNSLYPVSVGCGTRLVTSCVLFFREGSRIDLFYRAIAFNHVSFTLFLMH